MALTIACIQNSEAIVFFSLGRLDEALAEWKDALSSIKKAVDSDEATSDSTSKYASTRIDGLVTRGPDFEGLKDEQHIVSMYNKAFALADTAAQEDENLLAAILLYNIGVAYSMQRQECSDASRVFKLYRLSLQILLDSDRMWHSSTTLLLMALYNNIAHIAFCVHEIKYAVNALQELTLLLMDESVRANLSSLQEDFEFFRQNTLVLASDMSFAPSPAA